MPGNGPTRGMPTVTAGREVFSICPLSMAEPSAGAGRFPAGVVRGRWPPCGRRHRPGTHARTGSRCRSCIGPSSTGSRALACRHSGDLLGLGERRPPDGSSGRVAGGARRQSDPLGCDTPLGIAPAVFSPGRRCAEAPQLGDPPPCPAAKPGTSPIERRPLGKNTSGTPQ